MATIDSVKTKMQNLLSSLSTKMGTTYTTFTAAINALPSKKTQSNVSVSGKTVTTPAGIYFSQVQGSVPDVSGSIGGTATAGKATGVITNMDKMAVVTSPTGTAGVDYFRVAATATGTAGSYTPKYTVSKAGYIGSTVTGSAQSVSVTGDTTGQKLYIPKAKFEVSGKSVKTTSSGGGYIPADTTVGSVAEATRASTTLTSAKSNNTLVFTASNPQATGYVTADNSKNTASKTVSLSTSGATVTASDGTNSISNTIPNATFSTSGKSVKSSTAGYVAANTTVGTVSDSYIIPSGTKTISSSGTHDVKAYASASVAAGSCTVSGGGLSVTNNYSGTPTVDITLDGQTTSGVAITGTKPSSGYYLTLGASSSALSGTTKVTRNAVTQTQSAGYISAATTTPIASTTASPTVTVNKGTKTEYVTIPTGGVSSPSITVNTNGVISASATKTAGYITAGTASNTKKATDLDANLIASNIKKNVKIFGVTGSYEGGASVGTCTVKLGIDTMEWYANNNVRVFYTSYSSGAFNTNVVQTSANATSTITLSNVVCGSAISVWTQVYAYIDPSTYTKYTDEYNHCIMCPNSPNQTVTIDLIENS
jgi:hypothetical protein